MANTIFNNKAINQAIEFGFDFSEFTEDDTLGIVADALFSFFNDNSGRLQQEEAECDVTGFNGRQHVSFGDYESDGGIVDFSEHWHKSPDTKVFHSEFIFIDSDGLAKNQRLYYLVGETDYNAPDGYIYSKKEGRHVKLD